MADKAHPHRALRIRTPYLTGRDVRGVQRHLVVDEDGVYGPATRAAARAWVERAGGSLRSFDRRGFTRKMQRILRGYRPVPAAWKRRAAKRANGPQAAIRWAGQWVGRVEDPPGSNRAPWGLTRWQQDLGAWLVGEAWCGVFVGTALKHAGVPGVTSRVAGVILILEDARLGRNGFKKVVYRRSTGEGSLSNAKPGDAVGLFGESTHVGLIESVTPRGFNTIEGNTSPGTAGSQSNGGGVFRRFRPLSDVAYVVRPAYK